MILLSGPNIAGKEWEYVKECLDTAWVSSVGSYVTQFENMMAEYTNSKYAIATSSGTTALHISLILAGVERNDYVLAPNLTFIATLNSISYTGASPILVDIDEYTWQMNIDLIDNFLDENATIENGKCILKRDRRIIRAIMPVHVLGNMVDMDRLHSFSEKWKITVIEDATEALGSSYKGKHSGTFGKLGCFSFNGNKIITTGGGGMIITNDEVMAQRAKHLTTQAKADPFEYYHDEIGYNYRLVNVLAAMGVAQMEQLSGFILRKKQITEYYQTELKGIGDISFQKITSETNANCWLFTFRTSKQKKLLDILNGSKMQSRPFWMPMNQLPMFLNSIYISNDDKTGQIYKECLSIPCSTNIKDEELKSIVEVIASCY